MTIDFAGQVAIVTGAGGGLGRSYALALAERGARVVVNDFGGARDGSGASSAAAQAVVAEIEAAGGEAMADAADVTSESAVQAMVAATRERFGRLDILICNAGILRDRSFGKMSEAEWRAVVDVHLTGSANCARAAWGAMRDGGFGRILLTTSTSGLYGNFGQANYGAAKMALVGLMNTLHIEGARHGIHVNCIAPTAATRMTADLLPEPMLAVLDPRFVTPAAVFLVSRQAPSRTVMLAGAGSYGVVEIRESAGLRLAESERTPETIAERFEAIASMEHADLFTDGAGHVAKIVARAGADPTR